MWGAAASIVCKSAFPRVLLFALLLGFFGLSTLFWRVCLGKADLRSEFCILSVWRKFSSSKLLLCRLILYPYFPVCMNDILVDADVSRSMFGCFEVSILNRQYHFYHRSLDCLYGVGLETRTIECNGAIWIAFRLAVSLMMICLCCAL